jgi:hypothetical protein
MAAKLSALRTGRALLSETLFFCFWYSFLLGAESTPGPIAAGRIKQIVNNSFTSPGLELATLRLGA